MQGTLTLTAPCINGAWSLSPDLSSIADASVVSIQVQQTNITGTGTALRSCFKDATPPAAPTVLVPAHASTVSAVSSISGSAEANSVVSLSLNDAGVGTTTADPTGAWSVTLGTLLPDGVYRAVAISTDTSSNVGPPSFPATFTVHFVGAVTDLVITSPTEGTKVTPELPLTVSGTGLPSIPIVLFVDGLRAGTTDIDAAGNWSLEAPGSLLTEGDHLISATGPNNTVSNVVAITADPALLVKVPRAFSLGCGCASGGPEGAWAMAALGLVLASFRRRVR